MDVTAHHPAPGERAAPGPNPDPGHLQGRVADPVHFPAESDPDLLSSPRSGLKIPSFFSAVNFSCRIRSAFSNQPEPDLQYEGLVY